MMVTLVVETPLREIWKLKKDSVSVTLCLKDCGKRDNGVLVTVIPLPNEFNSYVIWNTTEERL